MARYIDAERIEYHPQQFFGPPYGGNKYDIVTRTEIERIPTADVREEIHGHWKLNGTRLCECSVCGAEGNTSGHDNYCRNCGAIMDEIECKNCGAFSISGMNYCSHCGTIMDESEEE